MKNNKSTNDLVVKLHSVVHYTNDVIPQEEDDNTNCVDREAAEYAYRLGHDDGWVGKPPTSFISPKLQKEYTNGYETGQFELKAWEESMENNEYWPDREQYY